VLLDILSNRAPATPANLSTANLAGAVLGLTGGEIVVGRLLPAVPRSLTGACLRTLGEICRCCQPGGRAASAPRAAEFISDRLREIETGELLEVRR
jgi:hypothetical protein